MKNAIIFALSVVAATSKVKACITRCWSLDLGYPCCNNPDLEVVFSDENGDWSVENNQWCGLVPIVNGPATDCMVFEPECWSSEYNYECCTEKPNDLFKDDKGLWGMVNGGWCGIQACTSCTDSNIQSIDKYGNIWGIDPLNNKACIADKNDSICLDELKATCRSALVGYMCCKETTEVVYRDEEFGAWGIENGQWCGFNDKN
jgi:hypothetical protein